MSDETENSPEEEKKPSKLPLLLGLLLAILGGGAGFYLTWSGMLLGGDTKGEGAKTQAFVAELPDLVFVEVMPMTVSIRTSAPNQHLKFRAQLEVPAQFEEDVKLLLPRVVDVLTGYLRALELRDLENPSALMRLRAQMLRRVQVVVGSERVNDLLVMEFVLN